MEQQLSFDIQTNDERYYVFAKRVMDVIICISTLIILLPIFIIVPILIKLDSDGPIIFRQARIGKNNKQFYIYKFRSMKIGTPNVSTSDLINTNEYTSSLGRFLRKTSIDELPQIFNVLKGEMSIIGPRPVIGKEKKLIRLREEYKINTLLPGITGLAQINGRDYVNTQDKVKYDYQYLLNKSILMDLNILVKTCVLVIKEDGVRSK